MNRPVRITVLVNNTAATPSLLAEHGLSLWIEAGDKHILWDTGRSAVLFDNAEALGIDLTRTDAVAVSHGHHDHTGSLANTLALAPHATLYLHLKAMHAKYSFKNGQCRPIGMSRQSQLAVFDKDISGGIVFVDQKTEIYDGMILTGPVPRTTPYENTGGQFYTDSACTIADELPDDQSLFFECEKGIVVVLGCAHCGVVNTLNAISRWTGTQKFHAVIGGMHLVHADTERLNETIRAFKRYDIQSIAPLHCTGSQPMQRLKETFGDRCLLLGTGSRLCL